MSNKKKICGHASKAKSKAKRRTKNSISISELDTSTIEIGKIIGNISGTQYVVENIIDKSKCHTNARSNVRAFRIPPATLVAYSIMRTSFDHKLGTIKKVGEIIKIISEDEYDELTEVFPQITKNMIYLSLQKINVGNQISNNKSLYENIGIDEMNPIMPLDDLPDYDSYIDDATETSENPENLENSEDLENSDDLEKSETSENSNTSGDPEKLVKSAKEELAEAIQNARTKKREERQKRIDRAKDRNNKLIDHYDIPINIVENDMSELTLEEIDNI